MWFWFKACCDLVMDWNSTTEQFYQFYCCVVAYVLVLQYNLDQIWPDYQEPSALSSFACLHCSASHEVSSYSKGCKSLQENWRWRLEWPPGGRGCACFQKCCRDYMLYRIRRLLLTNETGGKTIPWRKCCNRAPCAGGFARMSENVYLFLEKLQLLSTWITPWMNSMQT